MTDLATRIEQTTGPDRELDQEIGVWFRNLTSERRVIAVANCPRYTASLDAALTLVPEGWLWQVGAYAKGNVCNPAYYRAVLRQWRRMDDGELEWPRLAGVAATPALALCAAALRAREAKP